MKASQFGRKFVKTNAWRRGIKERKKGGKSPSMDDECVADGKNLSSFSSF